MPSLYWDIFCRVIDNHGDIGVCWRLASQLAHRGHAVRLWVDDASALEWMAPTGVPGVEVRAWMDGLQPTTPPDVLVEAFGCDIRTDFIAACAERVRRGDRRPVWINLEYLSAENWVPRHHPAQPGPAGARRRAGPSGFSILALPRIPVDCCANPVCSNAGPALTWRHGAASTQAPPTNAGLPCSATSLPPCPHCWHRAPNNPRLLVTPAAPRRPRDRLWLNNLMKSASSA